MYVANTTHHHGKTKQEATQQQGMHSYCWNADRYSISSVSEGYLESLVVVCHAIALIPTLFEDGDVKSRFNNQGGGIFSFCFYLENAYRGLH